MRLLHVTTVPQTLFFLRGQPADLGALAQLVSLMRRLRPGIVHAHTPKGGLLGTAAARIAA